MGSVLWDDKIKQHGHPTQSLPHYDNQGFTLVNGKEEGLSLGQGIHSKQV